MNKKLFMKLAGILGVIGVGYAFLNKFVVWMATINFAQGFGYCLGITETACADILKNQDIAMDLEKAFDVDANDGIFKHTLFHSGFQNGLKEGKEAAIKVILSRNFNSANN